jgi:hypothetical protein
MAVYAKVEAIAINTGTGPQSVSGLGFTPKLVIFQSTPDTADIVSSIANEHFSFGAFDGTNQVMAMTNSRNGIVTSDADGVMDSTDVVYVADPPGTITPDYIVRATSLDVDGFTMNVFNAPPINYRLGYMALGGDDITNVFCGTFQSKGSTGTSVISGLGFKPDLIILFGNQMFSGYPAATGTMEFTMGFGNATDQFSGSAYGNTGNNPQGVAKAQQTGYIYYAVGSPTFASVQAQLVSLDTDGFTLNYVVHSSLANHYIHFIAIKGTANFKSSIGTVQLNASTSGSSAVAGLPYGPSAGLFLSSCQPTNNALVASFSELSIGFVDESKNHFVTAGTTKTLTGSVRAYHTSHDNRIMRYINYVDSTLREDASISSWNSDGFTVVSDIGGPTSYVGYLVLNATGYTPPPIISDVYGFLV